MCKDVCREKSGVITWCAWCWDRAAVWERGLERSLVGM